MARRWTWGALGCCAALLLAAAAHAQPAPAAAAGQCRSTPSAPFDWRGKNVLWLGTSIPHQGIRRGDSYPELFCRMLGCRVLNNAFSGSRMRWDERREDESCRTGRNAPKGLSATTRELQAKVEAALPDDGDSSYDASCNRATRPLMMGYEERINRPWSRSPFDVVVIDHGHNDRPVDPARREAGLGTLQPAEIPVSAIEKGPVTRVVVAPGHGLRPYDDITVRTPGIPRMDYWTGEVVEVDGNTLTLRFDSRQLPGTYAGGGSVVRHDKSKLYDAYNLVISDILHMNAFHGGGRVLIVLATPPTEWVKGRNGGSVAALNAALARLAQRWGLPLYDMTADLGIGAANLRTYLPDGTHPNTPASREFIARKMADWARRTPLVFDSCSQRWSASSATGGTAPR